jgi:serine/threonine-protein kinase RsbW
VSKTGRADGADGLDEIRLELPASPEFLRLARVTATGLASRLGFTFDDVEDLRLAIDELCFALIGHGTDGTVRLQYRVHPQALEIEGTLTGPIVEPPKLTEWSDQILTALVDEHEVSGGENQATFRLLKRRVMG